MSKIYLTTAIIGILFLGNTTSALSLALNDVTLNGDPADAYYSPTGAVSGNDDVGEVNTAIGNDWTWLGGDSPIGGEDFTLLAKSDASSEINFSGFEFDLTLTPVGGAISGTYTLSWEGGVVPASFDYIFAVKSSTFYALYFFDDVIINATPSSYGGSYEVTFLNASGNNIGDISHLSAYGRTGTAPVPEPATMLLFGTGLVGLAGIARRRNKK